MNKIRLSIIVAPTRSHQPASSRGVVTEDPLVVVGVPHTGQYEPEVSD
jgi:hypothetical protein